MKAQLKTKIIMCVAKDFFLWFVAPVHVPVKYFGHRCCLLGWVPWPSAHVYSRHSIVTLMALVKERHIGTFASFILTRLSCSQMEVSRPRAFCDATAHHTITATSWLPDWLYPVVELAQCHLSTKPSTKRHLRHHSIVVSIQNWWLNTTNS